jgi:ParB/RepB/Spo0J family partition protein
MKASKVSKVRKEPHPKQGSSEQRKLKKKDTSERKAVRHASAPADQKTAPSSLKPVQLRIKKIRILPNRRKLDNEAVMTITESMRKLGQLQPIMVRKIVELNGETAYLLVDGDHRINAGLALGWEKITAVFFQGDVDDARVYELTQNLQRANNTRLYRAKCLTELVGRILGEARAKELAQPGGPQPGDKGISKTARVLGYTRDDIRRSSAIASISDDAMTEAEEQGLDDNERALLRIAKQKDPDEQVALAQQLGDKKKRPKKRADAADKEDDDETYAALEARWGRVPKFQRAYREATENARRKFIRMLQNIPLPKKDDDEEQDDAEDDED